MMIGNSLCVLSAVVMSAVFLGCGTAPREDASFRIVSYNIRHGQGMDGVVDVRNAGRVIARENPRFVGVQEVDVRTTRVSGADACAILEEATGLHATFAKAIDFGGGEYGNSVLSREVPLNVRRISLPGAEPRVLLLCEFEDCWFGTMHLAVDSEKARLGSIEIVRKAVAECGPKPVFLSGDWNATFHGGRTGNVGKPSRNRCIDYIAVDTAHRGECEVGERRVIQDNKTSDHYPIVTTISFRRNIK